MQIAPSGMDVARTYDTCALRSIRHEEAGIRVKYTSNLERRRRWHRGRSLVVVERLVAEVALIPVSASVGREAKRRV